MGYDVFRLGALCLDDKIQLVPEQPTNDGDVPQYDGKATISFGTLAPEDSITWIKPNGSNLLVADRVLLSNVSWKDLNKHGFVEGSPISFNGTRFLCRLLHVGDDRHIPNEWDKILDKTGEDNDLWHWKDMYFWGAEVKAYTTSVYAIRGFHSARYFYYTYTAGKNECNGFRPALEPLPSDTITPNINLDGVDFHLGGLPGSNTFCPILQPTQENAFKNIPVGSNVRMYTFTKNRRPIHVDEPVKDPSKLILTDCYFGDEYLIPWIISNGVAVASQSILRQDKS